MNARFTNERTRRKPRSCPLPAVVGISLLLLHPGKLFAAQVIAWGSGATNSGVYPDLGQSITPTDLTNAVAIAAGSAFSLALQSDGTVRAWGDDALGQTDVPADLTGVISIAASYAHALALKSDGTIIAWGSDAFQQTQVPADLTNAVAIAAGSGHNLALKADGSVVAWGDNTSSQTDVPAGATNVVAIAAGGTHCLALRADGSVVAWGGNSEGQTSVPLNLNNVIAVAAGISHSIALKADGSVAVWGSQTNAPITLSIPTAAFLSTAAGNGDRTASKSNAWAGNLVLVGREPGSVVIDGRIMANGAIVATNISCLTNITEGLFGTQNQLPAYTTNSYFGQLVNLNRLIAVADASGNHFTNAASFVSVMKALKGAALEGVVVVDLPYSDLVNLSSTVLPQGINIRGTLFVNFKDDSRGSWFPSDKIVLTAALRINPADLSFLNAGEPGTFTSGLPVLYTDPAKNPINIDISTQGYPNFTLGDDLPALIYNNAIFDIHGPVNISGLVYTPSFIEIENKVFGQTQYIKGVLLGGAGIYLENVNTGISILSCAAKPSRIVAGPRQNFALMADGTLKTWGSQSAWIPASPSNVVSVAGGDAHVLALVSDGQPFALAPLQNPRLETDGFKLSIRTTSGRVYMLQYKDSWLESNWHALPLVAGTGQILTLCDPAPAQGQRFYRLCRW